MLEKCVRLCLSGNSIQKWMWVEKGVPGVSTCTVWQSEYPFLICPFVSCGLAHNTNAVWGMEVSCNSFHTPYCPVSGLVKAPGVPHRPVTIKRNLEVRYFDAENIAISDVIDNWNQRNKMAIASLALKHIMNKYKKWAKMKNALISNIFGSSEVIWYFFPLYFHSSTFSLLDFLTFSTFFAVYFLLFFTFFWFELSVVIPTLQK